MADVQGVLRMLEVLGEEEDSPLPAHSAIYVWEVAIYWLEGRERTDWAFGAKGVTNTPEEATWAMKKLVKEHFRFPRTNIGYIMEDFVPGKQFGPIHETGIIAEVGLGVRDKNEVVIGEASIMKVVPLPVWFGKDEPAIANRRRKR